MNGAGVHRLPALLFGAIVPELERYAGAFPWDLDPGPAPDGAAHHGLRRLGVHALREAMRDPVHRHHATDKRNIRLGDDRVMAMAGTVCRHLTGSGLASGARLSGKMAYPPGGWMGWHTNADSPGWRLYVNYVHRGGGSFFRWWNGAGIESDHDRQGLNFRLFRVRPGPDPLWHCVHAAEWRLSMGFILDDVADLAIESALHPGAAGPVHG